LRLTETGEGYFKRVVDILSLFEGAEDYVSRRNSKPRGQLKITAPTSFSRLHVAPHLPDFLERYPEIDIDFRITDDMVDIIRENYDVAIRIGQLEDSSLVAKKLANEERFLCASPGYLSMFGAPESIDDLQIHNCLTAGDPEVWRLEGPGGTRRFGPRGNVRTNSSEFTREATFAGVGISLLSSWDVGPALMKGDLRIVLPEWRGVSSDAIWAVYPSRDFMPSKVNVFIDYLTELYGLQPYWSKDFDINEPLKIRPAKSQLSLCKKAEKSKANSRTPSEKKPRGANDLTC
jgi:DNA-binding transcriptional LysR family regulator